MGRIGITLLDVENAALQLQGRGKNPTVDAVREILGTGSKSTIAQHLKVWKSQQPENQNNLPQELVSLVTGLWERLNLRAEERIADIETLHKDKIENLSQKIKAQDNENAQLKTHIIKTEEALHQETHTNKLLQQELTAAKQESVKITERAHALEINKAEQQQEIERLHQLLKHVQHNLEHYQTATQELRQEQALLLDKQRCEYEQRITALQKEINLLNKDKAFYQAKSEQIQTTHETLQVECKKLVAESQQIQIQYQALMVTHEEKLAEVTKLSQIHEQQGQALKEILTIKNDLQMQLTVYKNKMADVENAFSEANDMLQVLRQENLFLSQHKANLEGQLKQLQTMLNTLHRG